MKGYTKYFGTKFIWFIITFICAFILNFTLPRLMPGDPVAAIVSRFAQGLSNATGVQAIYEQYTELFGTNKPIIEQFFIYAQIHMSLFSFAEMRGTHRTSEITGIGDFDGITARPLF